MRVQRCRAAEGGGILRPPASQILMSCEPAETMCLPSGEMWIEVTWGVRGVRSVRGVRGVRGVSGEGEG